MINGDIAECVKHAKEFIAKHGGFDRALCWARTRKYDVPHYVLDVLDKWDKHRAPCDCCGRSTQLGELREQGDSRVFCPSCWKGYRR